MADPKHLEAVQHGSDALKKWRWAEIQRMFATLGYDHYRNSDVRLDLTSASLPGLQLPGGDLVCADLSGADLGSANLVGADLTYANLTGSLLGGADLSKANLSRANLTNARFFHATMTDACLEGADLTGVDFGMSRLGGANLKQATLTRARMWNAYFVGADLSGADLSDAEISGSAFMDAKLIGANLSRADFVGRHSEPSSLKGSDLSGAQLVGTNLTGAWLARTNLSGVNACGANLTSADMTDADLTDANLAGANLSQSNLNRARMLRVNLRQAELTGCSIYGVAAWGIDMEGAKQAGLVITPENEAAVTVDDIELGQFIYLLLYNPNVRRIIDAITSKVVLLLGRFTDERKGVLDALRVTLRARGYSPVLFDFDRPAGRDLTETISTLAHMARFVIADITDAKSIPQELAVIAPELPSVPIQPLLQRGKPEYAMFEHFRRFPWVLPVCEYESVASLQSLVDERVIGPAETLLDERESARRASASRTPPSTATTQMGFRWTR